MRGRFDEMRVLIKRVSRIRSFHFQNAPQKESVREKKKKSLHGSNGGQSLAGRENELCFLVPDHFLSVLVKKRIKMTQLTLPQI